MKIQVTADFAQDRCVEVSSCYYFGWFILWVTAVSIVETSCEGEPCKDLG